MVLLSWCLGAHFTLIQECKNSKACKPQQTRKSRSQQIRKIQTGLNKQDVNMDEFAAYAANTILLTPAPKHPNHSRR